jgi:Tfp pilus assembly protein PilX
MRSSFHFRRGMMSVVAMLYMILFAVLAVGFYATVNVASQVAYNDVAVTRAQYAAETGIEFARHQLSRVSIPPSTTDAGVTNELYADLSQQLNGTANLAGRSIARSGATISIPGSGDVVVGGTGTNASQFNVTVIDWPQQGKVVVRSTGTSGSISRSIQLDFSRVPRRSSIFDYAIASRGQIVLSKGAVTTVDPDDLALAKAMSALVDDDAVRLTGGALGGRLAILDGADVVLTRGSVDGSSSMADISPTTSTLLDAASGVSRVDRPDTAVNAR